MKIEITSAKSGLKVGQIYDLWEMSAKTLLKQNLARIPVVVEQPVKKEKKSK